MDLKLAPVDVTAIVGTADKAKICYADWSEAIAHVDDTMEEQLKDGKHCFRSSGKAWNGDVRSGLGSFFCKDSRSFGWLEETLTGLKVGSGKVLLVWEEDNSPDFPFFIEFTIPKSSKMALEVKSAMVKLISFNDLHGAHGEDPLNDC